MIVKNVLIPETECSINRIGFAQLGDRELAASVNDAFVESYETGKKFIVEIDGERHECEVRYGDTGMDEYYYLGNGSLLDDLPDTGENFLVSPEYVDVVVFLPHAATVSVYYETENEQPEQPDNPHIVFSLYNGVKLPSLPEWDEDTYPYAIIYYADSVYYLIVTKKMLRYQWDGALYPPDDTLYFEYEAKGGYWELTKDTAQWLYTDDTIIAEAIWANYDVYDPYGGTDERLDASDPIPIEEPEPNVWETICANGGKDYAIGDYVMLDLGTIDGIECGSVRMCKVAEGEDGTASTWMALDSLKTSMNMNDTETTVGGWEKSKRRAWLNGAFLNGLPDYLRSAIVPTTRYSLTNDDEWKDSPTTDRIWIPSAAEICNKDTSYRQETKGTYYGAIDAYVENRRLTLGYEGTVYRWWHRTVGTNNKFRGTAASGGTPGSGASAVNMGGIVIGFSLKAPSEGGDISAGIKFLIRQIFNGPFAEQLISQMRE